jgi:hypothetical protein
MELARPSNVGSLIGAVMVGVLAVLANYYVRMDPRVLQGLLPDSSSKAVAGPIDRKQNEKYWQRLWELWRRTNTDEPRSPEQDRQDSLERMKVVEKYLLDSSERKKKSGEVLSIEQLDVRIKELNQLYDRLRADANTTDEQHKEARLSRLYGYYLAADMAPASYSEDFLDVARELTDNGDETESSHAAALKMLHESDFLHPDEQRLLSELQEFTQTFSASEVGVYLYSIISRELWQNGHSKTAEAVLRLGMETYAGQHRSRLFNQLQDQQRLPRPRHS